MEKIATFTTPEARFLSNFYPYKKDGSKYEFPTQVGSLLCSDKIKVFLEGLCFDCTENAYQAAKTKDIELRKKFTIMSPYEAKAYWNGKEDQIREDWDSVKYQILKDLNRQKFTWHLPLMYMLAQTGDAVLEEGNTWGDTYWGICDGVGENNLGKILMEIRDTLPFPVLYKNRNGNLELSTQRRSHMKPIGMFPFKGRPSLLVHLADRKMTFEEGIAYYKKFRNMHSDNNGIDLYWQIPDWSMAWEFMYCEKDILNFQVQTGTEAFFCASYHTTEVSSDFLTQTTWLDLRKDKRDCRLLQIILTADFKIK